MNSDLNRRPNDQHGFTIVELLIATTLGLLILVAVVNIFVSSRQSFRTQEGLSQIQETGRSLNYLMYPYIRLAGYLPAPITQTDPSMFYTSTTRALGGTDNDSSDALAKDGTDTITVRYRGQSLSAGAAADGSITNCAGVRGITGVSDTETVTSTFYLTTPSNGLSDLQCVVTVTTDAGAATTSSMPILQGVQDMQILYGTGAADATTGDRTTTRYYTADSVPSWTAITAVQISLTVDSIDKVAGNTTSTGANAGRLRRTFTTTLQIRNRLN